MVFLYGGAGRLTAENGGFRPGQCEGFTFEGPVEEHQPVKTYFKSSAAVSGDQAWQAYLKHGNATGMPKSCDQCTSRYEGIYSTHVYASHVQGILEAHNREQQIGGSGGSLEPPGPLS